MKICLKNSVKRIKEYLKTEKDEKIRLGLYMALNTIRNDLLNTGDEDLLNYLDLNDELEKYL